MYMYLTQSLIRLLRLEEVVIGLTSWMKICFGFKPYTASNIKEKFCTADL